jgi:hypothetical protein
VQLGLLQAWTVPLARGNVSVFGENGRQDVSHSALDEHNRLRKFLRHRGWEVYGALGDGKQNQECSDPLVSGAPARSHHRAQSCCLLACQAQLGWVL